MNGVDRFQLAIDALSRADISVSELVRGMSGAFAVRSVPGAREAIDKFSQRREELRRQIRVDGDDPPEIKNWVWPSGEPVAA
jgi:phosphoketolase